MQKKLAFTEGGNGGGSRISDFGIRDGIREPGFGASRGVLFHRSPGSRCSSRTASRHGRPALRHAPALACRISGQTDALANPHAPRHMRLTGILSLETAGQICGISQTEVARSTNTSNLYIGHSLSPNRICRRIGDTLPAAKPMSQHQI